MRLSYLVLAATLLVSGCQKGPTGGQSESTPETKVVDCSNYSFKAGKTYRSPICVEQKSNQSWPTSSFTSIGGDETEYFAYVKLDAGGFPPFHQDSPESYTETYEESKYARTSDWGVPYAAATENRQVKAQDYKARNISGGKTLNCIAFLGFEKPMDDPQKKLAFEVLMLGHICGYIQNHEALRLILNKTQL